MEIKVAFYSDNPPLVGKIIQWWTASFKGKWNGEWKKAAYHVEISFKDNEWYAARAENNMFSPANYYMNPNHRVYTLSVSKHDFIMMQEVAIMMTGKQYDWVNIILSDVVDLRLDAKDKYTCDEAVARILKYCKQCEDLTDIPRLNPRTLEEYVKGVIDGN